MDDERVECALKKRKMTDEEIMRLIHKAEENIKKSIEARKAADADPNLVETVKGDGPCDNLQTSDFWLSDVTERTLYEKCMEQWELMLKDNPMWLCIRPHGTYKVYDIDDAKHVIESLLVGLVRDPSVRTVRVYKRKKQE